MQAVISTAVFQPTEDVRAWAATRASLILKELE